MIEIQHSHIEKVAKHLMNTKFHQAPSLGSIYWNNISDWREYEDGELRLRINRNTDQHLLETDDWRVSFLYEEDSWGGRYFRYQWFSGDREKCRAALTKKLLTL